MMTHWSTVLAGEHPYPPHGVWTAEVYEITVMSQLLTAAASRLTVKSHVHLFRKNGGGHFRWLASVMDQNII